METIGGRKLIFGVSLIIFAALYSYLKGDVPANLLSFIEVIYGSFVAGNSIGTVAGVVQSHLDSKGQPVVSTDTVDLTPVLASVEELKAADTTLAQNVSLIQQTLSSIIEKIWPPQK